jgi:MFS family permease
LNQPENGFPPVPDFAFKLNEPVLQQLVACLRLLLRGALLFILAGFVSAMLPFQPWKAMWYLRFGQTGFEYGITILFAFSLAILVEFFEPDVDRAILRRMRLLNGATIAAVFFAVLIPLQIFSYGQVWIEGKDQSRSGIAALNTNLAKLRQQIRSASSVPVLNAAMRAINATPPAALQGLPLAEQQRRLLESIDQQQNQLDQNFERERQQKMLGLLLRTIKGVLAAGILAITFQGCRRILTP